MAQKEQSQAADWMERPVFREHQRLTPERLNRMHENHAARLRHALLGLAGPGVVYGYAIDTDDDSKCKVKNGGIHIGCGLAIDCHGRQLYWPGGWINVSNLCGEEPKCEGKYTLRVHYAERHSGSDGHCGDAGDEADWIEEGVVFTLTKTKECSQACDGCPDDCCAETECVDLCDYVCGRVGADNNCIPADDCLPNLCKKPGVLCDTGCRDWLYDHDSGLQLACVEICDLTEGDKGCEPKYGFCPSAPEVCDYRSYVYRNPLLFELIQGCHIDLAQVETLSFKDWLNTTEDNPLEWKVFANGISAGLEVGFTKPIKKETLNKSSLIFTAIIQEYETLFLDTLRIPIDTIKMLGEENGCAKVIHIRFDQDWLDRQIESDPQWPSRFNAGAIIEFTVRGAMLRDTCGRMLDGRPLNFPDDKPGQEMPGDDFIVSFCVAPKPRSDQKGEEGLNASDAPKQSY